ncbi:acylneuraminate cytidylyltransferase family protein [Synechococcus sp. RS9916]|uniref:acylneuraminate cytidylyltransferase family protein n=1 Tax=Synechococcus sp. RS9916 TaxID=221359 RepID=UPI0006829381|nr:acylneuraminate cytidylyltransferase family protein [Synechococcus sp. RS9916]
MKIVNAFIFARGGSKGLPGKNILPLGGVPLITRSIQLAQDLKCVKNTFVSTDCPQIADIASSSGAEIIMRPADLATDTSPEWLSWQHAIKQVQNSHGDFDSFLSLPTTSPLRSIRDVEKCINSLNNGVDICITMTPSRRSPWFNMVTQSQTGFVDLVSGEGNVACRQQSKVCYDMTTVAYVARPDFVLNSSKMWDGKVYGVEVPAERAIDIDTPLDFEFAEFLLSKLTRLPQNYESI